MSETLLAIDRDAEYHNSTIAAQADVGPDVVEYAPEQGLLIPAWAYTIFGAFVVVGTANAVNLTDGLDGLAIGPSIMNAAVFLVFAYISGVPTTILSSKRTRCGEV